MPPESDPQTTAGLIIVLCILALFMLTLIDA